MLEYVEKRRVPVRLSQPGQDPVDGFLMLAPKVEAEDRAETLLELLNSSRVVIPFIQAVDQQVVLLIRANVDWVTVKGEADLRLVFPPNYKVSHGQRVQLSFTDAHRLEAFIQWDRSDPHMRLSDFLNRCEDFFPVVASFGMLFVNRQRVRQLRLAEATPQPVGAQAHSHAATSGGDP